MGHRCMSALVSNVDQLTAQAAKMEKILPEMLKPLATGMVRLSHLLPSFAHASPSSSAGPQESSPDIYAPEWGLPYVRVMS